MLIMEISVLKALQNKRNAITPSQPQTKGQKAIIMDISIPDIGYVGFMK